MNVYTIIYERRHMYDSVNTALFCVILLNSVAFSALYIKVVY